MNKRVERERVEQLLAGVVQMTFAGVEEDKRDWMDLARVLDHYNSVCAELQQRRQQDVAREKRDAAAKALADAARPAIIAERSHHYKSGFPDWFDALQAALKAWEEANDGEK